MNIQLSKQLGLRIRELRIASGYKQGELADLLNMERSNLTRIENGKQRPNDENIVKLAEVLNVEIKDLFDFEHFVDKKCITSNIVESLADLNEQELQYIYKTINNIKQLR